MLFTQKSGSSRAPTRWVALACLVWAFLAGGCQPSGPKSLLLGAKYIGEGDYQRALRHLQKASDLMPAHPQVWNHLGLAWHGAKEPNKAAEAYQRALRIDAKFAPAHFNLGMLLLEQGRVNDAIGALSGFVSLQPTNALGFAKLGHALVLARRPDDAERALLQALRLNPKDAEAHNHLGLVHVQRKRMRDAMLQFSEALEDRPNYAPAILNQGIVAQTYLGNARAAIERYRAFASLTPDQQRKAEVTLYLTRLEEFTRGRVVEIAEATNRFNLPPAEAASPPVVAAPATNNMAGANTAPPLAVKPQEKTNARPAELPSATNLLAMRARSNALASAQRTNPPASRDPEREQTKPSPLPVAQSASATNAAPAANPDPISESAAAPIEVVEVTDEPEFRSLTDVRSPTGTNTQVAAAQTKEPSDAAPQSPLIVPRRDRAAEQKPGLLERANPMRWFRNDEEAARTAPRPVPPPVRASDPAPEMPAPVRVRPEFARYPHQKNASMPKGNRADAERYFAQGARAHQDRRLAAAIEYYRQAVTADPSFFEAQYNLGLAAYQMRDLALALAANENAVRLKPESVDARYHFGIALRDANYPVDAAEQLRQLLGEAPNDARAHLALANLYAQILDEAALAQRHYQTLLDLAPNHPEAPAIRQWLASRR